MHSEHGFLDYIENKIPLKKFSQKLRMLDLSFLGLGMLYGRGERESICSLFDASSVLTIWNQVLLSLWSWCNSQPEESLSPIKLI